MVAADRAQASLVFSMEPVPVSPLHLVDLGGPDAIA